MAPELFRQKMFLEGTPSLSQSTSSSGFKSRRIYSQNPPLLYSDVRDADDSNPVISEQHSSMADLNMALRTKYLPAKFSNRMLSDSFDGRRDARRSRSERLGHLTPETGLCMNDFRNGENRMSKYSEDDESDFRDDSSTSKWLPNRQNNADRKLRWNKFKWCLFIANILLTIYSFVGLIFCILTWFNTFQRADVLRVGNRIELIISTLTCCLGVFTSLIGWAGILLNNRSFLAIYTFLLWIVFIFILIPGYMTYKRRTFNLEGKINAQWSHALGALGRLRIQHELSCCGFFSPFVEATVSQTCYARSILPGCKLPYMTFEKKILKGWYTTVFILAPVHIVVMITGLLCSNHVTYRFGKGMMPEAYRLSLTSMAIIMESYANQLAEQYGENVTRPLFGIRSKSKLQVSGSSTPDNAPAMVLRVG